MLNVYESDNRKSVLMLPSRRVKTNLSKRNRTLSMRLTRIFFFIKRPKSPWRVRGLLSCDPIVTPLILTTKPRRKILKRE